MDEIARLRDHAARLAASDTPLLDVSDRVLATIRRQLAQRASIAATTRPLWLAAAASLFVAASLGIYAQQAVADLQDPVSSLFMPLVVTLQ